MADNNNLDNIETRVEEPFIQETKIQDIDVPEVGDNNIDAFRGLLNK